MKRFSHLCLLFLLITVPIQAIDEALPPIDLARFPTLQALQQSQLPIADRVDLARRFSGLMTAPHATQESPTYQIGDLQTFTLSTTESDRLEEIPAVIRAISEHAVIWVEVGGGVSDTAAAQAAARFDSEVYEFTRSLWGSEDNPGIDGDPRIHLLFSRRVNPNISAYFAAQNTYPREIVPDSNEHEMLIFNLDAFGLIGGDDFVGAAAHEFQHMIRNRIDRNESAWLEEAFSMLTEHLLGVDNNGWAYNAFLGNPATQLNTWGTGADFSADYGAGMLFLVYLYDRYGLEAIQRLSADPADGLQSVDEVLRAMGKPDLDSFFADWVLANLIRDPNTIYGYQTLPSDAIPIPTDTVYLLPDTRSGQAGQYGTTYFTLHNPPDHLNIDLMMPDTVGLIPDDGTEQLFFYSNHGDESNPTLTYALDLRDSGTASLRYRIWYDLEPYWDYGYLSVSLDSGQTWQLQQTAITTLENPNGKAYGAGFTGDSGSWIDDQLVLDAFAGQEILIRFEMITDDSLNKTGIALKDIQLETANAQRDLPVDVEQWQMNGWIVSDNRLPQRAWLQAVQYTGNTVAVRRWLAEGNTGITLDSIPGTSKVVLAYSPFAPVTLQPVEYLLSMDE